MDSLQSFVATLGEYIWYVMFAVLIAAGLFLTVRTRAVQVRSIGEMFRVIGEPSGTRADGRKQISSFLSLIHI